MDGSCGIGQFVAGKGQLFGEGIQLSRRGAFQPGIGQWRQAARFSHAGAGLALRAIRTVQIVQLGQRICRSNACRQGIGELALLLD
ncbi:MAG: hypothetical protein UDG94_01670, partial [Peptococcaceae bacterium]|nr:hypothetical protein [Peptococcaceae bacterium]